VARASTPALDTLTTAIIDAQQAGLAPAGDPMPLVLTAWSTVHGLASLWLDGPLARAQRKFIGASSAASAPEKLAQMVSSTLAALLIGGAEATRGSPS
jgi:hypothetical protein